MKFSPFIQLLRPYHWIKNFVVWSAPVFALHLTLGALWQGSLAFAAFSFIASTFYIINDLKDAPRDRLHPKKQHRPLASGTVSKAQAWWLAIFTGILGLLLTVQLPLNAQALMMSYVLLQIAYNLRLKQEPILDLITLSAGFVIRALVGAVAIGVPVSKWFILCLGLLAFFLGIEKRKAERMSLGAEGTTRVVLAHYSIEWLHRMEAIISAAALMAYALWTIESSTMPYMLTTIPFVLYSLFRYQYLTEQGFGETPEITLFADRGMRYAFIAWLLLVLVFIAIEKKAWPFG